MKPETIELRRKTLVQIIGLEVGAYTKNGVVYFQFGPAGKTIATVCTYRKAKLFAEGFRAGVRHNELLHERSSLVSKLQAAIKQARRACWRAA